MCWPFLPANTPRTHTGGGVNRAGKGKFDPPSVTYFTQILAYTENETVLRSSKIQPCTHVNGCTFPDQRLNCAQHKRDVDTILRSCWIWPRGFLLRRGGETAAESFRFPFSNLFLNTYLDSVLRIYQNSSLESGTYCCITDVDNNTIHARITNVYYRIGQIRKYILRSCYRIKQYGSAAQNVHTEKNDIFNNKIDVDDRCRDERPQSTLRYAAGISFACLSITTTVDNNKIK